MHMRDRRVLALLLLTTTVIALTSVAAFASSTVRIKDDYFAPRSLTVRRGTRVTWAWGGYLAHNVTVKSGPARFHSRTMVRGTFSWTFSRSGTYHLYCTIHPFMTMTVVVR